MIRSNRKLPKLLGEMRKQRVSYIFILPSIILFLIFVLYPLFQSVIMSFQHVNLVTTSWAGLDNYINIFNDAKFYKALWNTALFVIILVPFTIYLSLETSMLVFPLTNRYQSFFRAAYYLPTVISGVMISLVWKWMFNSSFGLLNYLIGLIGMQPVDWLATKGTIYPLMFVVFTFNFGLPFIIYLAALNNIPEQLYEAARIDGASRRRIKWQITVPLLKPTTFFLLITNTIAVFQVWVVIQLLTDGGPAHTTETIVYQIYTTAFRQNQYGLASAMGVILLVIILAITLIQKLAVGEEVDY